MCGGGAWGFLTIILSSYAGPQHLLSTNKLEDLKRSPDLLNNVKIGQGQLRLIN